MHNALKLRTAIALLLVFAVACSNDEITEAPQEPETETEEQEAQMSQEESGTRGNLERVVASARLDLATRLDIEPDAIELAEARAVTWRNGALGCPQEGAMYTQALVEGFYVRLEVDGQDYPYHAGRDGKPFACDPERSEPPAGDDSQPTS